MSTTNPDAPSRDHARRWRNEHPPIDPATHDESMVHENEAGSREPKPQHWPGSEVAECGCIINVTMGDRAACRFGQLILDYEEGIHALIDHVSEEFAADPSVKTNPSPRRAQQALLHAVEGLQQAYRLHVRTGAGRSGTYGQPGIPTTDYSESATYG